MTQKPSANRILCMRWVEKSLRECGGSAHRREVINSIWDNHEAAIRANGSRHCWQDDVAWAVWFLRQDGTMLADNETKRGIWALNQRKFAAAI